MAVRKALFLCLICLLNLCARFVCSIYTGIQSALLGTLAEKMRAGGAGIPAFYTPAGVGTALQLGGLPVKYDGQNNSVVKYSQPKESRNFGGKEYVLEESITSDYALVKAWKGDKSGNLIFRATARNFNPDCAKAARITIAEVLCCVGHCEVLSIHCQLYFGFEVNSYVIAPPSGILWAL